MSTTDETTTSARLGRETWRRFAGAIAAFASSEVRGKAATLAAALVGLLLAISGFNVLNSYVGRDFMTAIERRDHGAFVREAILYVAVFGASTVVAVLFRFTEERLGLLWRAWLTKRMVTRYLADHTYHRLSVGGVLTNPDQRMTEDVRTFVTMTLSLSLMLLNGTITVVAFAGVLWSISRTLFLVGIGYAAVGSAVTVLLGRSLVRLNYRQADREADFRVGLVDVRENAESIALAAREPQVAPRLLGRLDALVDNLRHIIAVNRNVGFFTTGYNYMIQIIPALIVAPLFIRGQVEFGVIAQSAMAFAHLLGAFSLIVTQFQAISSYAAVLARLTRLAETVQSPQSAAPTVEVVHGGGRIAYERVTLRMPRDGRTLVHDLSGTIAGGRRVLVRGSDAAGAALLRATAGLWEEGTGRITRPPAPGVAFLPERPYIPFGTLREVLATGSGAASSSDGALRAVLAELGIDAVFARAGGVDVERDWEERLSLREQQLLSVARLLLTPPSFVLMEHLGRTLDDAEVASVLRAFMERGMAYVAVGADDAAIEQYDEVLDVDDAGGWTWTQVQPAERSA